MLLVLDVGNSNILAGVLDGDKVKLRFRRNSKGEAASDEIGVFLKTALRENGVDPARITGIAACSVVPEVSYALRSACIKYFGQEPFLLQSGVKTGLNIKYKNPQEVGADRIANAIAGTTLYPGENLVIVDFGTATTFCAVAKNRDYLGGLIMPGLRISMEALASRAALLRQVEIMRPAALVGRTTVESIQSGLYHSNLEAVKGIYAEIKKTSFSGENARLVGTGGFSKLFEDAGVFDTIEPDLVLQGMRIAWDLNRKAK
jgi:type III pantothenate kinase